MYNINDYYNDLDVLGLEKTWNKIMSKMNEKGFGFIKIDNIGEVYEIGLAYVDKINKKELGKYYTPDDVAEVMSKWLVELKGNNVCDVCCGTGSLILAYLRTIGIDKAKELLDQKRIFLYDFDNVALFICRSTIALIYGKEYYNNINCISGDFLNNTIVLPENCKVISNPPYFRIKTIEDTWNISEVIKTTKEFYSSIMEKILINSEASVIITPYSFISGEHFYSLRKVMNNYNGFIVSFDNIPGSIFNGRKHGIFNSNSTNSVRAAITITENKNNVKGYKCSELIRFKSEERNKILDNKYLESIIENNYQVVSDDNRKYYKCNKTLSNLFNYFINNEYCLNDYISEEGKYSICIPNTCRYFTVGSIKNLNRTGKYIFSFENKEIRDLIYCFINSSFCYWYWRLYDGGITYSKSLLLSMPTWINKISSEDKQKLISIAEEMQKKEKDFIVYKMNAGTKQENIKFPIKYRNKINEILINYFDTQYELNFLENIHYNCISKINTEDEIYE